MIRFMGTVVDLLDRPTYSFSQVDRILGLTPDTARRWIDGYVRAERRYAPVIRDAPTGETSVTWGEFVETRLLAEYRGAGVPMLRLRPTIEVLRAELKTRYPLASEAVWLDVHGRELIRRVQEEVGLEKRLALVVVRTNQRLFPATDDLDWSAPARRFSESIRWSNEERPQPIEILAMADNADVVIDPLRGFGDPVVRNVPTQVIAELIRAGDPPAMIAELYELPESVVDAAVRYELSRIPA